MLLAGQLVIEFALININASLNWYNLIDLKKCRVIGWGRTVLLPKSLNLWVSGNLVILRQAQEELIAVARVSPRNSNKFFLF